MQRYRPATPDTQTHLGQDFRVGCWNMQKGKKQGWLDTLRELAVHTDLLFLQEAYLTRTLRSALQEQQLSWDLATTYSYRGSPGGLLTTSTLPPTVVQALHRPEPVIKVPKAMLVTRYPLAGSEQELLVVHVHIINFTLGTRPVQDQLLDLGAILAQHAGPVIVCGDFNTWKEARIDLLKDWIHEQGLNEVTFSPDHRTTFFGHAVDYVFYRGLEVTQAVIHEVSTSDHNPLFVNFRFPP